MSESLIQKSGSKLEPFSKLILKVIRKIMYLNNYGILCMPLSLWWICILYWWRIERIPSIIALEFKGQFIGSRNWGHRGFWLFLGLGKNVCLCIQGATLFIGLGNSDEQRWSWAWAWKYRGWPSYSKTRWFSCVFQRIWVIRICAWSLQHTTNKEMEIKNVPSLGDRCHQIWDFIFFIFDPTSPAFIMAKQAEMLHTLKFK